MSEWISLKDDKKPMQLGDGERFGEQEVIVFADSRVTTGYFRAGQYDTDHGLQAWWNFEPEETTHWMPLPPAPIGD